MNSLLIVRFRTLVSQFAFLTCVLYSFLGITQTSINKVPSLCKQYAIESAQLAHQSYLYSQKSYFDRSPIMAEKNIDTALVFILESIVSIDSAIVLASDSDILALKYANIAKNYAVDSYQTLNQYKKSQNNFQKKELSKKATFYSANVTTDAYHSSFYFSDKKKKEKKTEEQILPPPDKPITKLDVDQTLFALLKEELNQKTEINKQKILKLSEEVAKTKDLLKQSELNNQLKKLELQEKEFDKKSTDAQQKLTSINALIVERDKTNTAPLVKEETVFSKSIIKTDKWNNQVNADSELPKNIVYQIQLGVFKNTVPIETFKGLTPIYSKPVEKGISYSTGLFEKLEDAKEAKNYILNIGLTDVFIVAYFNNKKITLQEAVKLEKK